MTSELAGRETGDNSQVPLRTLVDKYGTQAKAAKAWGISQSTVSLLLSGQRGSGTSEALRAIAEAEGIAIGRILLPSHRRLHLIERADSGEARFEYNLEDPHWMLKQLQHWFSDLPPETRIKRQVVRAVMRVLFDESFDTVHQPSRQWRVVMQSAEGLDEPARTRKARARGPR